MSSGFCAKLSRHCQALSVYICHCREFRSSDVLREFQERVRYQFGRNSLLILHSKSGRYKILKESVARLPTYE